MVNKKLMKILDNCDVSLEESSEDEKSLEQQSEDTASVEETEDVEEQENKEPEEPVDKQLSIEKLEMLSSATGDVIVDGPVEVGIDELVPDEEILVAEDGEILSHDIDYKELADVMTPLVFEDLKAHFQSVKNPVTEARASMAEWLAEKTKENGDVEFVIYLDSEPTAYLPLSGNCEFLVLEINPRIVGEFSFVGGNKIGVDKSITPIQFHMPQSIVVVKWDNFNHVTLSTPIVLTKNGRHPEYSESESSAFVNQAEKKSEKRIEELDSASVVNLMNLAQTNIAAAAEVCKKNNIDLQSVIQALSSKVRDSPDVVKSNMTDNKKSASFMKFLKRK